MSRLSDQSDRNQRKHFLDQHRVGVGVKGGVTSVGQLDLTADWVELG